MKENSDLKNLNDLIREAFMDENNEIFEPDAKKHFIISGVGFWISFCNICDHCSWNDDKTGFYLGTHRFLNMSVVLSIIRG